MTSVVGEISGRAGEIPDIIPAVLVIHRRYIYQTPTGILTLIFLLSAGKWKDYSSFSLNLCIAPDLSVSYSAILNLTLFHSLFDGMI